MLTAEQQQKNIQSLLKRPQNNLCSDCNGKSPCWASLDFGVFVCMNCSGAHRALGPSITRVRSTKLDTWNKDWLECMKIGNSILNKYWQAQLSAEPFNTKPNVNSSLNEIKKYVVEKYVKKKYANSKQQYDPLTRVRKGLGLPLSSNSQKKQTKTITSIPPPKVKETSLLDKQDLFKKSKETQKINNLNKNSNFQLLDFDAFNQQKTNSTKNFQFDFLKPEKSNIAKYNTVGNKVLQSNGNDINFLNLEKVSTKQANGTKVQHATEVLHSKYFTSCVGFANNSHGSSVPSHHNSQTIPNYCFNAQNPHDPYSANSQVTMNINMNMYPNITNINMNGFNHNTNSNLPTNVSSGTYYNQFGNHQNDKALFDNFNELKVQPKSNITLQVTLNKKQDQKQDKSWIDDWK